MNEGVPPLTSATLGDRGYVKIPVEIVRFWGLENKPATLVFLVRNRHVVLVPGDEAASLISRGIEGSD